MLRSHPKQLASRIYGRWMSTRPQFTFKTSKIISSIQKEVLIFYVTHVTPNTNPHSSLPSYLPKSAPFTSTL
jgi:hypothetical protein